MIGCISKLRKKNYLGINGICAKPLEASSLSLAEHLTLLYQMIFYFEFVPYLFSTGIISLVNKKGKPTDQCCSFRPIIVSPVLCKIFY